MTPRGHSPGTGLPGPGQDRFPEAARKGGREVGLTSEVTILRNNEQDDGGGAPTSDWNPVGKTVGRVEPMSSKAAQDLIFGEQVLEEITHIASVEPDADVTTSDRLEMDGYVWIILGEIQNSDPLIKQFGVRHK